MIVSNGSNNFKSLLDKASLHVGYEGLSGIGSPAPGVLPKNAKLVQYFMNALSGLSLIASLTMLVLLLIIASRRFFSGLEFSHTQFSWGALILPLSTCLLAAGVFALSRIFFKLGYPRMDILEFKIFSNFFIIASVTVSLISLLFVLLLISVSSTELKTFEKKATIMGDSVAYEVEEGFLFTEIHATFAYEEAKDFFEAHDKSRMSSFREAYAIEELRTESQIEITPEAFTDATDRIAELEATVEELLKEREVVS